MDAATVLARAADRLDNLAATAYAGADAVDTIGDIDGCLAMLTVVALRSSGDVAAWLRRTLRDAEAVSNTPTEVDVLLSTCHREAVAVARTVLEVT